MIDQLAEKITTLHFERLSHWTLEQTVLSEKGFLGLVEENHAFNFKLWKTEDKARRDDMGFEFVYRAKRDIDHFNQQRNNRMEMMDSALYTALKPASGQCPVHSETPGMMIDRLSILSLKIFHMHLQTLRTDVDAKHIQQCLEKLDILKRQQAQLSTCLDDLIHEVQQQTRTFVIYHQCKMYDDPTLNPELYSQMR